MSDRRNTNEEQVPLIGSPHPSAEGAFSPMWTTLDPGPPHILAITGVMEFSHPDGDGDCRFAEHCSGSFEMTLVLPDYVDPEKVAARFEGSKLRITAPRRDGADDPCACLPGDRRELSHSFADVQCCGEVDDEPVGL